METELTTLLKEYGLDSSEIKVFLFLVAQKELTAYRIAKEIRMNRSTCYDVLERLISKGFITKIERKNVFYYHTNPLSRVISSLRDKENILETMMPRLQQLEGKQETKISFLEGAEGQKQFNFDLFSLVKSRKLSFCYIIGNTYAKNTSSNLFIERLINEIKGEKSAVEYRGIWSSKFRNDKIIRQYSKLGKNKFIESLPSNVGSIIFDGYVAFLFTTDMPYVIEIKNSLLSAEMKAYSEYLWKISKE
jgi:predicted transcriptional regulator